ncbi:MAG: hypothetical protein LBU03_03955 [Tannerellaceae bacterium]|jgi:hypothetical protein|nr:hypothetical protein [Tannerellaceae bacterium]
MRKGCIILLIFYCGATSGLYGQVIRINNGVSITSLSLKDDSKFNLLDSYITPYHVSLGIDYIEERLWNLSTEIGYMGIGGKGDFRQNSPEERVTIIKEKGEYIRFATTVRVKTSRKYQSAYVGIGPSLNLLIGADKFKHEGLSDYRINKCLYGVKSEVGINSHLTDKLYAGINVAYIYHLNEFARSGFNRFNSQVFTATLTVGMELNLK